MKGKLIIFSAPSGSGKTTIVKHLLKQDFKLAFSISATSRAARKTETHGKDYYFLSPAEFKAQVDAGAFLEWEEVYEGVCYGTLKAEVERIRAAGMHVLFDLDVVGGVNVKRFYGEEALAVFVQPPSVAELERRLVSRDTDSPEVIRKRVGKAEFELRFAPQFDHVLINDQLEKTLKEAETLIGNFIQK